MNSWTDQDIQPQALTQPCHGCGGAFQVLSRYGLCDTCQDDWDDEMAKILNDPPPPDHSLYQGTTRP